MYDIDNQKPQASAASGNSSLMSDTDLEQNLKNLPQYDEETHQEMDTLTVSDYRHAIKASRRKPIKGIEKWL